MTRQPQPQAVLCPHLAAAVLWMNKPSPGRGKRKIRSGRPNGRPMDDLLAL